MLRRRDCRVIFLRYTFSSKLSSLEVANTGYALAAKSADGVQRYRVILSVLRAFGNRQRKTVLSSSNAHSKQERWGKGAKRRERKIIFIFVRFC